MTEKIIDGVRYIPAEFKPDRLGIWYMHDNHTFTKIYGDTLDKILSEACKIEATSSYGMLCPITLLHGDRKVRRVCPAAHSGSRKESKDKWEDGLIAWKAAAESDKEVTRLLADNLDKRHTGD